MGKDSQVANAKQDDMAHIRLAVRQLCAKYGEDYWLNMDRTSGYPSDFVAELTASGFLGVLIPEEYGGSGLGVAEACVVMEEICRSGLTPAFATRKCTLWAQCCVMVARRKKDTTCPK